jgi:hypothetical protein
MRKLYYSEWIKKNYSTYQSALANCQSACKAMVKEFPELKITNGFAHFLTCGPRAHWWLIAPDGSIVDPTAHQFPDYLGSPIMHYEEIDDDHDARKYPQQRCMNCGEYYYQKPELKGVMHTKQCERELSEWLDGSQYSN